MTPPQDESRPLSADTSPDIASDADQADSHNAPHSHSSEFGDYARPTDPRPEPLPSNQPDTRPTEFRENAGSSPASHWTQTKSPHSDYRGQNYHDLRRPYQEQEFGSRAPHDPWGHQSNQYPQTTYGYPPQGAPHPTQAQWHKTEDALNPERESNRDFFPTFLLAALFGFLGADRFYVGKIGTGILKLITLGGLGIWSLIDCILLLTGNYRDKQGRQLWGYEKNKTTAWIIFGVLAALGIVNAVQTWNDQEPSILDQDQVSTPATEAPPAAVAPSLPASEEESTEESADGGQGESGSPAAIGDQVTALGGETVTVLSLEDNAVFPDNPFASPPQGKFVLVELQLGNESREPVLYTDSSFMLRSADGIEYGTSQESFFLVEESVFLTEINPGNTMTGEIVFDIPADVDPSQLQLVFTPNIFDVSEVVISLQ